MQIIYPKHTHTDVLENTRRLKQRIRKEFSSEWRGIYTKSARPIYMRVLRWISLLGVVATLILFVSGCTRTRGYIFCAAFVLCGLVHCLDDWFVTNSSKRFNTIKTKVCELAAPYNYDMRSCTRDDFQRQFFMVKDNELFLDSTVKNYTYSDDFYAVGLLRGMEERAGEGELWCQLIGFEMSPDHIRRARFTVQAKGDKRGELLFVCPDEATYEKLCKKSEGTLNLSYLDDYFVEVLCSKEDSDVTNTGCGE